MKNYLTYRQLDRKCLELADINENEIKPQVREVVINDLLMKVYGLLDGVNHPFWNRTLGLTVAADQELLKDNVTNGGAITAIDSVAKTITRNAGAFVAGSLVEVVIFTKATDLVKAQFLARITVGGTVGTYVKIGAGVEATFAGATDVCTVTVLKKLSTTSVDISGDYVKKVVKVYDDQAALNKERVFQEYTDPVRFGSVHRDPHMDKDVAWYHRGNTIELAVGASATAVGVTQAEIVAKPALYTDATEDNIIDIPPEENQLITDEITAEYKRKAGKEIGGDLSARLKIYESRYQSAAADRAKAEETQKKR